MIDIPLAYGTVVTVAPLGVSHRATVDGGTLCGASGRPRLVPVPASGRLVVKCRTCRKAMGLPVAVKLGAKVAP